MPSRRRSYFFVPLFAVVGSLAAGIFTGRRVSAANPSDDTARDQSVKTFTKVFDAVEQNFADQRRCR